MYRSVILALVLYSFCFHNHTYADAVYDRQMQALEFLYLNQKWPIDTPRGNVVKAYCCFALASQGSALIDADDIAQANILLAAFAQWWPDPEMDYDLYWMRPHLTRIMLEEQLSQYLTDETKNIIKDVLYNWVRGRDSVLDAAIDETTVWHISDSDNHNMLQKQVYLSTAQILKNNPQWKYLPYDDGFTAQEHYNAWAKFFPEFFKQRAMRGIQVEFASPSYAGVYVESVFIIRDLAEETVTRNMASKYLDLYFADVAVESVMGIRGGAKVRTYKDSVSYSATADTVVYYSYILSGLPAISTLIAGNAANDTIPMLTSDYRLPLPVENLYKNNGLRGTYQYVSSRPGRGTHTLNPRWYSVVFPSNIRRTSYITPNFCLGTFTLNENIDYTLLIDQNPWMGLIANNSTAGRIYMTTEGDVDEGRTGYEDLQAVSSKGAMLFRRNNNIVGTEPRPLRVYINDFSYVQDSSGWIFGQNPSSTIYYAVYATDSDLWGSKYTFSDAPAQGKWITFANNQTIVIFEAVDASNYESIDVFKNDIKDNAKNWLSSDEYEYQSTYNDTIAFYRSKIIPKINGTSVELNPVKVYDSPYLQGEYDNPVVTIKDYYGNEHLLNFEYCTQFLPGDMNEDCVVNIEDFAVFMADWLGCTHPDDSSCVK